jgi:hypothetical protein
MMTSSVSLTPAADTAQHGLLAARVLKVVAVPVCRLAIGHQTSAQLFDGCPLPAVQHVAQCEVLPRGDGPSPDERVGTQLRLGYQAPGLQNGSTPVADLVRWHHDAATCSARILVLVVQCLRRIPLQACFAPCQ